MTENEKNAINELSNLSTEEKEALLKCVARNELKKQSRKDLWSNIIVLLTLTAVIALTLFLPEEYLIRYAMILAMIYALFNAKKSSTNTSDQEKYIDDETDESSLPPLTEEDLKTVAFHEAGHAVCFHFLPGPAEMKDIQIGLDEEDFCGSVSFSAPKKRMITETGLKNMIAGRLGGIIAEKIIFGESTNGAGKDLAAASDMAFYMTALFGMGKRVGLCAAIKDSEVFRNDVESDVRDIISECQTLCEKTLIEHRDILEKLAAELLEKKSLNKEEIKAFFAKEAPALV